MSKVSELLGKRIYGGRRSQFADSTFFFPMICFATITGANWLDLPCCCVFTTVPSTDMQQIGSVDNMCCFPFLVSQIFVQRSTILWALSTQFCSGFKKVFHGLDGLCIRKNLS